MYLLAAKILGPIALAGGLWWFHTSSVTGADKAGYARAAGECRAKDDIAVAVGQAQSNQMGRAAVRATETLHERIQTAETRNAVLRRERDARGSELDGMRVALDAAAAAPPSAGDPAPTVGSAEANLRRCEGLLATGLGLAKRADSLAGGGEEVLGRASAQIDAMKAWADIVGSSQHQD
jgi:hypothetical protein